MRPPSWTHEALELDAPPRQAAVPAPPAVQGAAGVLALQRSAGNQAVVRALAAARPPAASPTVARAGTTWDKDDDTIWVKDAGTRYEELEDANIAGNYPIIDDFRDGVGTSLKTIDIVSCYQGASGLASLRATVTGYVNDLAMFSGRIHSGTTVARRDVKELVLKIAIPPKPPGGVPGYDERREAVEQIASRSFDPDLIFINKEAARPRRRSTATVPEYAEPQGQSRKRGRAGGGEPEAKAPDTRVRLRAEVKEVPGIWGDVPGRRYEKIAFGGDSPAANIGGNFPTIDDLRGGVATSLKTINIVERFASAKQVTMLMASYVQVLAGFKGQSWPAGPNPRVPNELLSADRKRIVVKAADITSLQLKVGIPPVTAILAAKQAKLDASADEAEQDRLGAEIAEITAKHAAVMDFDGDEYEADSGKPLSVTVEEVA